MGAFYHTFISLCKVSKNQKDPVERQEEKNGHSGQKLCNWPFLRVTEKVFKLFKTEGSTSWQSTKAWDILALDLSSRRGSQAVCRGSTVCVTRSSFRPEASVPVAGSAAGRRLTVCLLLESYL